MVDGLSKTLPRKMIGFPEPVHQALTGMYFLVFLLRQHLHMKSFQLNFVMMTFRVNNFLLVLLGVVTQHLGFCAFPQLLDHDPKLMLQNAKCCPYTNT